MRTESPFDQLARETSPRMFGACFVLLRIALGAMFFFSGLAKFGAWSAEKYLAQASGPFATWFQSLAGNALVDSLNAWGMTLIGAALIVGLLVRPASVAGVVLMTLYYFAHFSENTMNGYVDMHVVFVCFFLLLCSGGAGHVWGLNGVALRALHRPNASVRWLLA